jgi:hypothetical protein
MKRKGVSYDVGRVLWGNWRPDYDPRVVRRELEIIRNDLHCNAIRLCAQDVGRLLATAEDALALGLEVWLSPELWNRDPDTTLAYLERAAAAAERLRDRWPDRVVLLVGSELTLFMKGIVPGRSLDQRFQHPGFAAAVRSGDSGRRLNEFLARAVAVARAAFHGPLSYASLVFETVDWTPFDLVGVDHYRVSSLRDQYGEMLRPAFAAGKPVVVTEFGCRTFQGSEEAPIGLGEDVVDYRSVYLHRLPAVGRLIRPRLKEPHVRDEALQARELVDQLTVLDRAGVDGAFVFCFVSPIFPYDPDPRFDVDMASFALVKTYPNGRKGTAYPDMTWEPKESFRAVAEYYAKH